MSSVASGEYPRLSRGRPGFDSPPGKFFKLNINPHYFTFLHLFVVNLVKEFMGAIHFHSPWVVEKKVYRMNYMKVYAKSKSKLTGPIFFSLCKNRVKRRLIRTLHLLYKIHDKSRFCKLTKTICQLNKLRFETSMTRINGESK